MKNLRSSMLTLATLSVLTSACSKLEMPFQGKAHPKKVDRVTNTPNANALLGDEKITLQSISESNVQKSLSLNAESSLLSPSSARAKMILDALPQSDKPAETIGTPETHDDGEESLTLGLPIGLIGEQSIFGGVITRVSDKKSEDLGGLKLTDLAPIHVRTMISRDANDNPVVTLVGCVSQCDENARQGALVNLPIVGVDEKSKTLIIDVSNLGQELDLISMLDPKGEYTKLKAINSATTTMEYDVSTLVFDVKTKMIPKDKEPTDTTAPVTEFTVRWYLKLNSASDPAFTPREPTEGVGFFKTERAKVPKITRWSATKNGKVLKYYIKNVPAPFQKIFTDAFSKWNAELKTLVGHEMFVTEVIPAGDPKNDIIVAGDIRYNVLEWDLDNAASYGGLGPSIANQYTGETLAANVLIQGPKVIEMYTAWFKANQQAADLKAQGQPVLARNVLAEFSKSLNLKLSAPKRQFRIALNGIPMNVRSQSEELQDPIMKETFDKVPDGFTFEQYMTGYFTDMLDHELGHNLGLRHNFKGNLGAFDAHTVGSVSRSIMEYLGKGYRYLDAIGPYDRMAIRYGYQGVAPQHLNWFCTDEDQGTDAKSMAVKSAECTKSDATSDPYSFWEARLARAVSLVVDAKTTAAPVLKVADVKTELTDAVNGLAAYALSADKTAETWTNFFGKADRPEKKEDVKAYVLQSFKKKLCDPHLAAVITAKESPEAQKAAQDNLAELKKSVSDQITTLGLYSLEELNCQ